MAKGISIHIGLNHVNPAAYGGWDGALGGCINDATALQNIAVSFKYATTLLVDQQATAAAVQNAIRSAASTLGAGDYLLLTYSGHGGQIPDTHGDEPDGKDETWVLYDRQLLDDELNAAWAQFQPGVRILVLSDSCHSGSVTRASDIAADAKPRCIPAEVALQNYNASVAAYQNIQKARSGRAAIGASILLLSGCQDHQLSYDNGVNGVFTSKLLQIWANGAYTGDHKNFWTGICGLMPDYQSPNYFWTGTPDATFEGAKPFTVPSYVSGIVGVGTDNGLWTRATPTSTWARVNSSGAVRGVAVMPNGKVVGIGMNNDLWTRETLTSPWVNIPSSGSVIGIAAMPDGKLLGIGMSNDLWLRETLTSSWVNIPNSGSVLAVTVMPNGKIVGVGMGNDLWTRETLTSPWVNIPSSGAVIGVAAMPDGSLIGIGMNKDLWRRETLTSSWANIPNSGSVIAITRAR